MLTRLHKKNMYDIQYITLRRRHTIFDFKKKTRRIKMYANIRRIKLYANTRINMGHYA